MSTTVNIFLADDHKLIRDAIKSYILDNKKYKIVGEASDGEEVLEKLKSTRVDVVLMDISMERMDGITCTKQLVKKFPKIKVLALTMLNENLHIKQMMNAGASGYLLKNSTEKEILTAIDNVMRGELYYSDEVTKTIMGNLARDEKRKSRFSGEIPLTDREKEVLRLILKQYSNKEIADELYVSLRTIDAHKRNLLEKTGAKNIAGLVIYAINKNLADDT